MKWKWVSCPCCHGDYDLVDSSELKNEIGPRECVLPWDVIDGALPVITHGVSTSGQLNSTWPAGKY